MKKTSMILLVMFLSVSFLACAKNYDKKQKELQHMPINCATAEGDIRALESEKAHVAEQVAMGVTAIVPIGLVVGILTGTEDDKIKIATGEYDEMIDKKIAEIKSQCGQ